MNITELRRWHWAVIGLLLGIVAAAAWGSLDSSGGLTDAQTIGSQELAALSQRSRLRRGAVKLGTSGVIVFLAQWLHCWLASEKNCIQEHRQDRLKTGSRLLALEIRRIRAMDMISVRRANVCRPKFLCVHCKRWPTRWQRRQNAGSDWLFTISMAQG